MILAAAAMLFSLVSTAQERNYYLSAGYGFAPSIQSSRVDCISSDYSTLASIYAPLSAELKLTGAMTIEGGYNLDKHSDLFLMGSFCRLASSSTTQKTGTGYSYSYNSTNGNAYSLLVGWRYNYIKRQNFTLYSSLAVGYGFYSGFNTNPTQFANNKTLGEIQVMPIGITLGKKVYWFLETGAGTLYLGGRTGVGYRF